MHAEFRMKPNFMIRYDFSPCQNANGSILYFKKAIGSHMAFCHGAIAGNGLYLFKIPHQVLASTDKIVSLYLSLIPEQC